MERKELGRFVESQQLANNVKVENRELLVEQDFDEAFYEKICRAYINTARLEWVTTNPENNSVVHGYFADDEESDKYNEGADVTPENFKDVAYAGFTDEEIEKGMAEIYEYDTWEDFYEEYIKDEIIYDIEDIGTYSDGTTDGNEWDFYVSKEDLSKLGLWFDDIKTNFKESKLIEGSKINVFTKTISIENIGGDTLMEFKVSQDGDLYDFKNCDLADEEDDLVRVQQVGTFDGLGESKK